jgi:D-alanyl-D-alanine carboxypeptidase
LGLIIEKFSGMQYQQYIQQNILNPLGIKHTYFGSLSSPTGRAPGHWKQKESQIPSSMAWSAGEMISNLDDMTIFIAAWYKGYLFQNKKTMQEILSKNFLAMGSGVMYGLGTININDLSWGHAGQTFGFEAYMGALNNGYSFAFGLDDASADAWMPAIKISTILF